MTYAAGSSTPVPSTTVGDAYFDNYSGNWIVDFYQNAAGDMVYTDIAASSDYVVAVAKKNYSPDYFVHVFRLSGDFLSTPIGVNNVFQITGNVPMGDILIEDISATDFVLAYHFAVGGGPGTELQQFRVDPVTPTIIIQLSLLAHHGAYVSYSPAWAMKQLCFDATRMRMLLLQDAATDIMPSVESNILSYTPSGIGAGYVDGHQVHRRLLGDRRQRWRDGHSRGILSCRAFHVLPNQVHDGLRHYTRSAGNQQVPRPANSVFSPPHYMNVSQKFVEFYMYCTER